MRLLIVTQAVDAKDPSLGFFVDWIRAFAVACERVDIICLRRGEADLPANVTVRALDEGRRRNALVRWWKYLMLLRRGCSEKDLVFFHMCPEYVLAGIPVLIGFHGRTVLWYAHTSLTWKLRLAARFVGEVTTATEGSLTYETDRKCVVGQGIPVARFEVAHHIVPGTLRLLAVGRVTPVKDIETLIRGLKKVHRRLPDIDATLTIAGGAPRAEDDAYRRHLDACVRELELSDAVTFRGGSRVCGDSGPVCRP